MTRRPRLLRLPPGASSHDLFAASERRAVAFITFSPSVTAPDARLYVKFGQDENDKGASETDFDLVLSTGQTAHTEHAFPSVPKGPVTVHAVNPTGEDLLVVASEFVFREVPAAYAPPQLAEREAGGTRTGSRASGSDDWRHAFGEDCIPTHRLPDGTRCRVR